MSKWNANGAIGKRRSPRDGAGWSDPGDRARGTTSGGDERRPTLASPSLLTVPGAGSPWQQTAAAIGSETMVSKVCLYNPMGKGGHARYTHELLTAMAELDPAQRVAMVLVTSRDFDARFAPASYPVDRVVPPIAPHSHYRSRFSWAVSRIAHYARRESTFLSWLREHPQVRGIHFQEFTPWLAPFHFRRLKRQGYRLFYTVHNIHPHAGSSLVPRPVVDAGYRSAWRCCDALFVHTDGLQQMLSDFLGPGHPPIFITPHGIWTDDLARADVRPPEERRRLKHLLLFGEIRPNKGVEVMFEAMRSLPDYRLTVAGQPSSPDYGRELSRRVAEFSDDRVRLMDRFITDDEVAGLFRECSMVVLPYTSFASQSGVLHDAIAYGTPVVATDVGALGESVRRFGIGRVVPANAPTELAAAVQVLSEPEPYRAASDAAIRARSELSWLVTAERTVAVYRSFCA
jgi:glycosyltransferase involved in cell wall biosynthesis